MDVGSRKPWVVAAAGLVCLIGASAHAQSVPWIVYADTQSDSVCDAVNAANVELVVLADNGPLVIITGPDLILPFTEVDDDGFVRVDGAPAGFIGFAVDGDGFRTLWWMTLAGTAIFIDPFTGEPSDSGLFPDEFVSVPCDACLFWDDPFDCDGQLFDGDQDGIDDPFDFCPNTPIGEPVDEDGCACFELDSDLDGVDDCDDFCPDTPFFVDVDDFGCECLALDDDFDGIENCDDLCPGTPLGEAINASGCACSQIPGCNCFTDSDQDGFVDCDDFCPDTPPGEPVDDLGCACFEIDSDGDGVDDCNDECPDTRPDEPANSRGCSCAELDRDNDGIVDCDDFCPNTPLGAPVDGTGCEVIVAPPPNPVVIMCGSMSGLTLALCAVGLGGMRLTSRRRFC